MDWHRVKTLLLALLILANGYLAYKLYDTERDRDYISDSYVQQAADSLKSRGIFISADNIPQKRPVEPIVITTGAEDEYASFVNKLAGENEVSVSVTETGKVYSFGNNMFTVFNDGDFEYVVSDTGENEVVSRRRAQSLTKTFVEISGLSSADFKITQSEESENGFTFTVQRYKNKLPIEDYTTEVEIVGKKVARARGKLLTGTVSSEIATDFSDSVNVLFAIASALDEEEMRIKTMTLTYVAGENSPEIAFTPMYVIKTDEYNFKYDLSTGQIIE